MRNLYQIKTVWKKAIIAYVTYIIYVGMTLSIWYEPYRRYELLSMEHSQPLYFPNIPRIGTVRFISILKGDYNGVKTRILYAFKF